MEALAWEKEIDRQMETKEFTTDTIRDIRILQSKRGYRFSVDALLLYHFVDLPRCRRIADIGAGSGIISILLAKKYPDAKLSAIEIQKVLYELALRNIHENGLQKQIEVLQRDIKAYRKIFKPGTFDLAVSNPPFRRPLSGLVSPEAERAIARHEIKITLSDLIKAASYLLKVRGRFDIIYHPSRLTELITTMKRHDLEPKRLRSVHSKPGDEAKMILLEAVKSGRTELRVEQPLYIYNEDGSYSPEMVEIYG